MKAKPTRYKGIQFRSRLEAQWAAFFDALGWDWEYEPNLDLAPDPDGGRWLPDFLVKPRERQGYNENGQAILVEVKGVTSISLLEDHECVDKILANTTGTPYTTLLVGPQPEVFSGVVVKLGYLLPPDDGNVIDAHLIHLYLSAISADIWDLAAPYGPGIVGPLLSGYCVSDFTPYGFLCGDEMYHRWAQAKNAIQWRPPTNS